MPYWGPILSLSYLREEVAEAVQDNRVTEAFVADEGVDFLNWAFRVVPEHALNRVLQTDTGIQGTANVNNWGFIDTGDTDHQALKLVGLWASQNFASGDRYRCRYVSPEVFFRVLDTHEPGDDQYFPPNAIYTWDVTRGGIIFLGANDTSWKFQPSFISAASSIDRLYPQVTGWRVMIRSYICGRWLDASEQFEQADLFYKMMLDEMSKLTGYYRDRKQTIALGGQGTGPDTAG
jgi:hypothetical protein